MKDFFKSLLSKAHSKRKENKTFLQRLAKHPPRNLDKMFAEESSDFFDKHSCLDCANCCKTTSPIFRDVDIERIAGHLKVKPGDLVSRYLHIDNDGHYVLNSSPCVFLGEDNYCSIYNVRPQACRDYPHTERKNIYQVMDLAYHNTLVCPAVAGIVEKLKRIE